MNQDNLLLAVAVIAVIVSIISVAVTYNSISLMKGFTGFASSTQGTVNLTVESSAVINFTTNTINWGSGKVNAGSALLITNGTVENGNWTAVSSGFVVENIGNVNVSFGLQTTKNADEFIGGTNPVYQWSVSDSEVNSCIPHTGYNLGTFENVQKINTPLCDIFKPDDESDSIKIDVKLVIPSDSEGGALSDTFTATIAAA